MKTVNEKVLKITLGLLILLILVNNVCSLTANIGNARMILNAKTGDIIDRTVLVKNINNVSVRIEIDASGDLEKYTTIKDTNFTLAPGEDRDAGFEIKVAKEGTTQTKINVKYIPIEGTEKNGVGLSSQVIINAEKGPGFFDDPIIGDGDSKSFSPIILLLVITGIIVIILIAVLIFSYYKIRNRGSKQQEDKVKAKKSATIHEK